MSEVLQKLSSYNIFNYLLPGVVFVILLKRYADIDLSVENVALGMFLYYFIGLVLSRIGSVLLEPTLKVTGIIKFSDYSRFIQASKLDGKIELLSEVNNTYRTIMSMIITLLTFVLLNQSATCSFVFGCLGLMGLFIGAYRKQSAFILKRIDEALKKEVQG